MKLRIIVPAFLLLSGIIFNLRPAAALDSQAPAVLHYETGVEHLMKRQYEAAIREFGKALEMMPAAPVPYAGPWGAGSLNRWGIYNKLGSAYFGKGDYLKAIADFNMSIELAPSESDSYGGRAQAYLKLAEYGKAIRDLNMLIALSPYNVNAIVERGRARARTGDYEGAIRDFDVAVGMVKQSGNYISSGEPYVERGMALIKLKRFSEAEKDLREAVSTMDNRDFPALGEIEMNLAMLDSISGRPGDACGWLKSALDKGYDKFDFLAGSGDFKTLRHSSCYNEYVSVYGKMSEKDWVQRAGMANDPDSRIGLWSVVLDLDPENYDAYIERGRAYFTESDDSRAASDFSRAAEINPRKPEAYVWLAKVGLDEGNVYQSTLDDLNKAIEAGPKCSEAYSIRAEAYLRLKKYKEALSDYSKLIELNPRSGCNYEQRAKVYVLMGEYKKAIRDALKNFELSNGDEKQYAQLRLARMAALAGRNEDACKWLKAALNGGNQPLGFMLGANEYMQLRSLSCYKDSVSSHMESKAETIK